MPVIAMSSQGQIGGSGVNGMRWRRKVVFAMVICVGFFAALEAILWLAGVKTVIEREDPLRGFSRLVAIFQRDGQRYKTRPDERFKTFNDQSFAADKPGNGVRLFCLGGSSSYGYPWDAHVAFTAVLGDVLTMAYPERKFEAINVSGISYAMYRLRGVAEELVEYEPDIFIVYSGHNEFVERSFYRQLKGRSRQRNRVDHSLSHMRVYAVARSLIAESSHQVRQDPPVDLFVRRDQTAVFDGQQKRQVIEEYRRDLSHIVEMAHGRGVKVVLATVPCNLRDWPPQKSMVDESLGQGQVLAWRLALQQAADYMGSNQFDAAAEQLEQAAAIAPGHAQTFYQLAQAYEQLGRWDDARQAYADACDLDPSPVRRLSAINEAVRSVAAEQGALLVDIERIFQKHSEYGLIGFNLIEDYVHPRLEAHQLIAWYLWDAIERAGWLGPASVAQRPIFDRVVEQRDAGSGPLHATWFYNQAVVMAHRGLTEQAIDKFRQVLQMSPNYSRAHYNLAALLDGQGKAGEAIDHYRRALRIDPDYAHAHLNLGAIYQSQGKLGDAAGHYLQTLQLMPRSAEAHANLGQVLHLQHQDSAAAKHLRQAISINAGLFLAHKHLGTSLVRLGQLDQAIEAYRRYLRLAPEDAQIHYELGSILARVGRLEAALGEYQRSLHLQPNATPALNAMARLWATHPDEKSRRPDKAIEYAQRAVAMTGQRNPVVLETLAVAYASAGNYGQAAMVAQQAMDMAIENALPQLAKRIGVRLEQYKKVELE